MSRTDSPELAALRAALDAHGCAPRPDGAGYRARCPAHGGDNPTALHVQDGRAGVVVTCHTRGCTGPQVAAALGLPASALFYGDAERYAPAQAPARERTPPPQRLPRERPHRDTRPPQAERPPQAARAKDARAKERGRFVEAYTYTDEQGQPLYRVTRYALPGGGKDFPQARYDADRGRYVPGMTLPDGTPVPRVLYRLPAVREAARAGRTVFVVEGEKDVHTLERLGVVATTSSGGAEKWPDACADALHGCARVVILPDADAKGENHARAVARSLTARGIPCAVVRLPGLPEKGDVTDWAKARSAAGGAVEDDADALRRALQALARAAPLVEEGAPWLHEYDAGDDAPNRDGAGQDADDDAPEGTGGLAWRPFPLAFLPRSLRDYAEAYAHATGVDVAAVAVPMLGVVSAAVGNSAAACVSETWQEPSPLWTVLVAPSGSGKSPALDAALAPVYALEREAAHAYRLARDAYDADVAAARQERTAARVASRPSPLREALDAARDAPAPSPGAPPKPPVPVRYRVGDVTAETVLALHADNPRGLLLARDELAGWLGGFDRYAKGGRGSDAQTWIELHGGRPVTVDRKSNAERPTLYVDRPAVAATGTIQPQILAGLLSSDAFASGFAARLLLAAPPMRALALTRTPRRAVRDVEDAYERTVRHLYARPLSFDDFGAVRPVGVEMTPEAWDVFAAFHAENAARIDALPETSALRPVLSKSAGTAARLALALHLAAEAEEGAPCESAPAPMSADAVRAGCTLALWFAREAVRLYARHGFDERARTPDEAAAERLPEDRTFTVQDVAAAARLDGKKSGYKVLRRLMAAGRVRCVRRGAYERVEQADDGAGLLDELAAALDALPAPAFDERAPALDERAPLPPAEGADGQRPGRVFPLHPAAPHAAPHAAPQGDGDGLPSGGPPGVSQNARSSPPVLRPPVLPSGPFAGVRAGETCDAFGVPACVVSAEAGRMILARADGQPWPQTRRATCTATPEDLRAGRVTLRAAPPAASGTAPPAPLHAAPFPAPDDAPF